MKPYFEISVGGGDITGIVAGRLVSLRVEDRPGLRTDSMTLTLDDRGNAIALPSKGAEISVTLGYEGQSAWFQGLYVVDEIWLRGPPQTLTIQAKAANMRKSLKAGKSRCWAETTFGDLVATVAQEHGYEARVSDELASIVYPQIDQTRESDMHLLTRLAKEHDAVAKVAKNTLIFTPRGEGKSASGKSLPVITIPIAEVGEFDVRIEDRGKYASVRAHWHDTDGAELKEVTAGDGDPVKILRETFPTEEEATKAASAKLTAIERGQAELDAALPGRPDIAAETIVIFDGARSGMDGEWVVEEVVHDYTPDGFTTRVKGERKKKS